MGTVLSRARLALRVAREFSELSERLSRSPGLPVADPSTPYWTVPPAPIAEHGTGADARLPSYADVVVIGSGITGTCVARTLLDEGPHGLKLVMLDARATCSGATARNGGHITPPLYHDYALLKKEFGAQAAQHIIRFRLAHLSELLQVAEEEGLLEDSQCRQVETFDVFFEQSLFDSAKERLADYLDDLESENNYWKVYGKSECATEIHASKRAVGAISTRAGAVHPYRLVTGILQRLLSSYSQTFSLFTHTPCTDISAEAGQYVVKTPKGVVRTSHVVHATNGWSSHLLEGMRRKIMPMRATMSAQLPKPTMKEVPPPYTQHTDASSDTSTVIPRNPYPWFGTRSFVIYPTASWTHYDYLTQQPVPPPTVQPYPHPRAEFMYGGGVSHAYTSPARVGAGGHGEIACINDDGIDLGVRAYLGGALGAYFGREFGATAADASKDEPEEAIDKHFWTGVEGISADGRPWVGRLPHAVTGRRLSKTGATAPVSLAAPGEWICAGYSGEGMVHGWLCANAVARMVLGSEDTNLGAGSHKDQILPEAYKFTTKRWKAAKIEERLATK
ncbi:FAD dependent oxidoreductase [Schizophyllum amplum]|uniref:FAD dependent oxidoreductase n=1 Tax=Schizophyllum amplum TaxID=97359 RepID=A0A550CWT9_9AGAR|nr:FAD dependent oxidoreductase [Auriculariopsis ampla]